MNSRNVSRYVAPTLREIRKRNKKYSLPQNPRSQFLEWNYNAELFAFSKRLGESFDLDILQKAFIHRSYAHVEELKKKELGIWDESQQIIDNTLLIKSGTELLSKYTYEFINQSLPNLPREGVLAIQKFLVSDNLLSNLAMNLGMTDLSLTKDESDSICTHADTFRAVIGALGESSSAKNVQLFIQDIVCTQLNQKDLSECWKIESPLVVLKDVCQTLNMGQPEPRLLGDTAKNTILSTYHIGIYSSKKLIGSGFGENISMATDAAAHNSLLEIFGITNNAKPLNFSINK